MSKSLFHMHENMIIVKMVLKSNKQNKLASAGISKTTLILALSSLCIMHVRSVQPSTSVTWSCRLPWPAVRTASVASAWTRSWRRSRRQSDASASSPTAHTASVSPVYASGGPPNSSTTKPSGKEAAQSLAVDVQLYCSSTAKVCFGHI